LDRKFVEMGNACSCARGAPVVSPNPPERSDAPDQETQQLIEGSGDEVQEPKGNKEDGAPCDCVSCCCFCSCFIIFFILEAVVWAIQPGCDADLTSGAEWQWNAVVPAQSMSQMQNSWMNFLSHEVYVYPEGENATSTNVLGYWRDASLLFGWIQKFAYVSKVNNIDTVVFEAWKPWGFYFGQRFNIIQCSQQDHQYMLEEDYWAKPFWNWNMVQVFNIKDSKTGDTIAKSNHEKMNRQFFLFGNNEAFWAATITAPDGTVAASIVQDKPYYGGSSGSSAASSAGNFLGFGKNLNQKWHMWNHRPDIVPNEVASFVQVLYDIDRAQAEKEKETSVSVHTGR